MKQNCKQLKTKNAQTIYNVFCSVGIALNYDFSIIIDPEQKRTMKNQLSLKESTAIQAEMVLTQQQ
ncbi:unnamed protein product (macronuclear) [Paramecium tetraurelia]|uniref:Uncharacterized protein n=1 Tax=Paramecium tetraurelia TaxID=5888 RepID=A0E0L9_PARTE|nr:uncharacterized protein GSPATT00022004001 [Paramecium tetraurelia]CAK88836.1 unnamed protein product [Paramecium tetraurelia]|eukprot:XP_001456233.1 hypothetical protein (macronuclear) [Paramecium tetraurelia strain d4-2]